MFNFLRKTKANQLPAATAGQLLRIQYLRAEAGVADTHLPTTALEAELIIGRLEVRHILGNSN
jgi:hypothetical protein